MSATAETIPLMMSAALAYAEKFGWPVFPVHHIVKAGGCSCGKSDCKRPGKHPIAQAVPHGLKDAARDSDIIRRWWRDHPQANIGVPTGAPVGWIALDVDTYKDGENSLWSLEDKYGKLPLTVVQQTGGGGWHYLFRTPIGVRIKNSVENLGPGLDVRGDGGYIIVAPSNHVSGNSYCWEISSHPKDQSIADIPNWLLDKIQAGSGRQQDYAGSAEDKRLSPAEFNRIRQALNYLDADNRDVWVDVGMALHSTGAREAFGLWSEWSQNSTKYDPVDNRRVWSSFKPDGGKTLGSLFHAAKAAGWRPPADFADTPTEESWVEQLQRTKKGYEPSASNLDLILSHDHRWSGVLAWDEFDQKITKLQIPPFDGADTGEWTDADDTRTAIWMDRCYHIRVSSNLVAETVRVVAERHKYHPVRDYLNSLTWDGLIRLKTWLIKYLGADDGPFIRSIGQCFMIGAVSRIFSPGCKFDNVMILEGDQGIGKSTALAVLANPWFSDTPFDLGSKDAFLAMRGKWIIEIGELDTFSRAENSRAKQFFASRVDTYRAPYGRHTSDIPRQCVFVGTANPDQYLKDETGNRRYWPVLSHKVNLDRLRRDRDQLWAEAVSLLQSGEPAWLDHRLDYVQAEQEARFMRDSWEDVIQTWLIGKLEITISEVMTGALEIPVGKHTRTDQMRVAAVVKRLGWRRIKANRPDGTRYWCYRRIGGTG